MTDTLTPGELLDEAHRVTRRCRARGYPTRATGIVVAGHSPMIELVTRNQVYRMSVVSPETTDASIWRRSILRRIA